jgi:O-antigen ligase
VVATVFAPGVILAALMLVPFYKGAAQPYSPVDITVVLAALNAVQVVYVLVRRDFGSRSTAGIVLWILLACLLVAGILYAPDQQLAIDRVLQFWALTFIPILPAALRVGADPRYVRQLLWAVFGIGLLTVILGVFALSSSDRLVVLGGNTISAGRAALFVPIIGLAFVLPRAGPVVRVATILLVPVAAVVSVASGSRGPLLMLLLIAGFSIVRGFLAGRAINWGLVRAISIIALISIPVAVLAAPELPGSSLQRFALFGDFVNGALSGEATASGDTSSGARVRLFDGAIRIFLDRPIVGAGPGGFEALSGHYLGPFADQYPHNSLLQVAAEFGIVGLGLFAVLVGLGLFRRLPPGVTASSLRLLFAFFLLNSMISGDILADRMTWGLLVILLCLDARTFGTAIPGEREMATPQPDSRVQPRPVAVDIAPGLPPARRCHRRGT